MKTIYLFHVYSNYRFGRGTQEDSHEVLRCLLSGLREEEINVSYSDMYYNIPYTGGVHVL